MNTASNLKEQLRSFFEEAVAEDKNLFLVDFYKNPKKAEFIFLVDGIEPVNLPSLSIISRQISAQIDELITDETPFSFQVSTPGADKPLLDLRQYSKHIGRTFLITTAQDQKIEGELVDIEGNKITLITKAIKKTPSTEITLIFEDIKEAIIKLTF